MSGHLKMSASVILGVGLVVCLVDYFVGRGHNDSQHDQKFIVENENRMELWFSCYTSNVDHVREKSLLDVHRYLQDNVCVRGRELVCMRERLYVEERLAQFYEKRADPAQASAWRAELLRNYVGFTNKFGREVTFVSLSDISNIVDGVDKEWGVK